MIKFETINGGRKAVNELNTPTKKDFPRLNREQRRALVYSSDGQNSLLNRVVRLRNKMIKVGIHTPNMPKRVRRKYLSGYMGVLVGLANDNSHLEDRFGW